MPTLIDITTARMPTEKAHGRRMMQKLRGIC